MIKPSVIFLAINLRISSMMMTGKDILRTANHSAKLRGVIWNTVCKNILNLIFVYSDVTT